MLISKKELLRETGISYGQLYRWKREGLIPEEWFIKKSAFTGQETFFPKKEILDRIKIIIETKDKYSLNELAKILSPEISEKLFFTEDLKIIEEIDSSLIAEVSRISGKVIFSYVEVLLLAALSVFIKENGIEPETAARLFGEIITGVEGLKPNDIVCVLAEFGDEKLIILTRPEGIAAADRRLILKASVRLNEMISLLKLKYRKKFLRDNGKFTYEEG